MYAIIETGGRQYRVTPGQVIDVDNLNVTKGNTVELDRVVLIADGERVTYGDPLIEGAGVLAISQGEVKGKKVIVFKYKPKVRYRKKGGHRQLYTRLAIEKIVESKVTPEEPIKEARKRGVIQGGA